MMEGAEQERLAYRGQSVWPVSIPALQDSKWSRLFCICILYGAIPAVWHKCRLFGARTGRLFVFTVHHGGLTIYHQSNTLCHSSGLDMLHMQSPASRTIVHLVPVMPALRCLDHLWGLPVQIAGI